MSPTRFSRTATALLALATLFAGACAKSERQAGPTDHATSFTVTDDVGREITFDAPVTTAVVFNSYNSDAIISLGKRDAIVAVDEVTRSRLEFAFTKDDVIGPDFAELNYEHIIELNPDVVILPRNGVWEEASSKLEQFDIPVLVATVWDPSKWNSNIDLLSRVFDAPERSAEILEFTDGIRDLVADRVKDADRPVVYYEDDPYVSANKENARTFSIQAAGGKNMFSEVTQAGGAAGLGAEVDPVDVLTAQPQVIFKEIGTAYDGSSIADFEAARTELLDRSGWHDLPAVEDDKVFVYNAWAQELAGRTFQQLYFAKWIHPELFEDVDPAHYVNTWLTEYLKGPEYTGDEHYVLSGV